jgi:hypothetical protein
VFRKLIAYLKSKLSNVAIGYAERLAVVIPFILALGFTVAAVHAMLIERFGSVTGNWAMAAALVGLGILGGIAVKTREAHNSSMEEPTSAISFSRLRPGILRSAKPTFHLMSSMRQPTFGMARLAWRHAPLVVFAGLLSALFYPLSAERGVYASTPTKVSPALGAQRSLAMRYAVWRLMAEQMF